MTTSKNGMLEESIDGTALRLIREAVEDWGDLVDDPDTKIQGSDAVEWLCEFIRAAQDIIKDPKFKGELKP